MPAARSQPPVAPPRRVRRRPPAPAPAETIYSKLGVDLRQRSLEKYRSILAAASRMFIAQGFGATSMDAIAEAAKVSKRTVYGHFDTKHALFAAVIQSLCAKVVPASLDELDMDTAPIDAVLQTLGGQFLAGIYTEEQIALFRTVINDARTFPELGALMFEGPVRRSEAVFADYLRRQVELGRLRPTSPELAAAQFMGMLKTNLHVELLMKPGLRPSSRTMREVVAASVDLFLHGAAPERR